MNRSGLTCMSLLVSVLWATTLLAEEPVRTDYPDFESYAATLPAGIREKQVLDLNADGKPDYAVTSVHGEQTFLDVLLSTASGLAAWRLPVAEGYEIGKDPAHREIRLRFETFPEYGNTVGGDLHAWFDFYLVTGDSLALDNARHKPFFRTQQALYRQRIHELEQQRDQMLSTFKPDDTQGLIELNRTTETLRRYNEWIERVKGLLAGDAAPAPVPDIPARR